MTVVLKIDHVSIAGSELGGLERAFANLGLTSDYGGPHSNKITHMALLGFDDGSYIELISTLKPGQGDDIFWGEFIVGNGGPCAWAVQVENVAAEASRVAALGIPVNGPAYYYRWRPDGKLVEWDLAFLGEKGAGARLPFIIKDITPREWRVHPSASVADGLLTGVARVILGVESLQASIQLFRLVYNWPQPLIAEDATFRARLAFFADTPVILAESLSADSWLPVRMARFGHSPVGYLIATKNFDAACERYGLIRAGEWFRHPLAWFDPSELNGIRLGVTGGAASR